MEEFEKIEALASHSMEYARNRVDEIRLELAEKACGLLALFIERFTVAAVFVIGLLFLSAAGAIALGEHLGHEWQGFLVVGGIYLIIGCFLAAMKTRFIRTPVMDSVTRYLFKNTNHDKD